MLPRYQTGFLWTVYRKGAWIANESANFHDKYSVSALRFIADQNANGFWKLDCVVALFNGTTV